MQPHRVQHHLNTGILHFGMFTDRQIGPAVGLALVSLTVLAGVGGSLVVRMIIALLVIAPALVMVLDNHGGKMLRRALRAWVEQHRRVGVYEPGSDPETPGYVLFDEKAAARAAQPAIDQLLT